MTNVSNPRSRASVARDNAERARQVTVAKLKAALSTISAELIRDHGVYLANARGLSRAEVARRAGISDVTLAKARHLTTRQWVDAEISKLLQGRPNEQKGRRRSHTDRIRELIQDNNTLRTQIVIHELERAKAELHAAALNSEVAELRDQLVELRRQSIVSLPGTKRQR